MIDLRIKMMKILASIWLVACFAMVCCLTACGETSPPDDDKKPPVVESSPYDIENVAQLDVRPLEGKTIYWLGSSVVYGDYKKPVSMAEYVAKRQNATSVKEAVSGTTIMVRGGRTNSYVGRMQRGKFFNKGQEIDIFICQSSRNDASSADNREKLGSATADDNKDRSTFDVQTTMGAIEFIISYVQETWGCPIMFFAGTCSDGEQGQAYKTMVDNVIELKTKWGINVLDLYNDAELKTTTQSKYTENMIDDIHPTASGYYNLWTPKFEDAIVDILDLT